MTASSLPKAGSVYRHHSGRVYTVLALANTTRISVSFPVTVFYMGANGATWTRPAADFSEAAGKFSLLYDGTTLAPDPRKPTTPAT